MLPIASNIANHAVRKVAESALPDAGVTPDAQPRDSHIRSGFAVFLRRSAERRNRLAERLDPVCHGTATRAGAR